MSFILYLASFSLIVVLFEQRFVHITITHHSTSRWYFHNSSWIYGVL